MKTIRLLYPDYVSGGLDEYYFGANLMAHILPENPDQPLIRVPVQEPGVGKEVTDGIYAKDEVVEGILNVQNILEEQKPDRIITIGGNCLVSLAPFDYLRKLYPKTGIIWIDSHPDVSIIDNGYPYAHAMVLGALLGQGEKELSKFVKNGSFQPDQILYVGLQPIHDYQEKFLNEAGVAFKIQDQEFVSSDEIKKSLTRFDQVLVHLDIDVLDPAFFHSTYFANPDLVGDGSGAGRMSLQELSDILTLISKESEIVGFSIAEYLPFDEYKLHKIFRSLPLFTD